MIQDVKRNVQFMEQNRGPRQLDQVGAQQQQQYIIEAQSKPASFLS